MNRAPRLLLCVSLLWVTACRCTIPVLDLAYRSTLHDPSVFLFRGRVWVAGGHFEKTVSETLDLHILSNYWWSSETVNVDSDAVFSIPDERAAFLLTAESGLAFTHSFPVDERLRLEGKGVDRRVLRESPFYVERGGLLFAVGGQEQEADDGDVWSTSDGVSWKPVLARLPWASRNGPREQRLLSWNGSLYAAAATGRDDPACEIWRSRDGAGWERVAVLPGLREVEALLPFRGAMILTGHVDDDTDALLVTGDGVYWVTSRSYPAGSRLKLFPTAERLWGDRRKRRVRVRGRAELVARAFVPDHPRAGGALPGPAGLRGAVHRRRGADERRHPMVERSRWAIALVRPARRGSGHAPRAPLVRRGDPG